MNKRGQLGGVAYLIGIIVVIILLAPIILKVALTMMRTTSEKFSQVDASNKSSELVGYTMNKLTSTFDWAIMLIIVIMMVVMLISAFLVDVHPLFLIVYIIGAFVLVLTAPYSMMAAEKIYSMSQFNSGSDNVIQYIPMTEFMFNNFGTVILGVIIFSGIIIFAKYRFTNPGGTTY